MFKFQELLSIAIAQDIDYILSNGRVKTPISLLLPSIIKQLTNNMEIITIVHKLSQGVSYSILNKMHTDNACIVPDQQENYNFILPLTSQKEIFMIYVAYNIGRKEETLSGKGIYVNQFASQRFIFAFEEKGLTAKQCKSIDPVSTSPGRGMLTK